MLQSSPIKKSLFSSLIVLTLLGAIGCQSSSPTANTSSPVPDSSTVEQTASLPSSAETESPSDLPDSEDDNVPSDTDADPAEVVDDTETSSDIQSEVSQGSFTDLEDVSSKEYISQLQQLGVFEIEGDKFDPYGPITRGEYVTWLFRANNAMRDRDKHLVIDPTFDPEFTDITEDHPAYKYVQAFANAGYSVGYEDNTFKPDQAITREEMIAIKVGLDLEKNVEPLNGGTKLSYADVDEIDPRYTGFIWSDHTQDNIPRAFGNVKQFKPKQEVKRHEAAASMWQIRFDNAEEALDQ